MGTTITRAKGTVRFAFRESNAKLEKSKNVQSLIILNFAYGKTRFRYSTGYKSCFDDWDFKKQRVKNKASITNKDEVNDFLSGLEKFINKKYSELTKAQGKVSTDVLKYHLDVYTKKIKPNEEFNANLSFFDVIQKFIDFKDGQISDVTLRSYKQTKKRLQEYEKHYGTRLMFQAIDMNFYNKFNTFMEESNYSLNTIGKHINTLRTFLNYALTEGYSTNQKFKSNDFKVKKEITTEIYLTDDEIKQLLEKDLSIYPEL